jgi:hypothetical protein
MRENLEGKSIRQRRYEDDANGIVRQSEKKREHRKTVISAPNTRGEKITESSLRR